MTAIYFLGVDPGADQGWALFDLDGRLIACGLGDVPRGDVFGAVIERPVIYPRGKQKARPRDVITLAIRAGETGGKLRAAGVEVEYVEPRTWKRGALRKSVSDSRIRAKLSAEEKKVLLAGCKGLCKTKAHNVVDAVGIGLFGVGR
jgi:hypothetical protein